MPGVTYKQMLNEVLVRLREDEVDDVNESPYSRMIGSLLNRVKREVEDAWDWQALRTTYEIRTAADIFNYTLVSSSTRFRVQNVWNTTTDTEMQFMPSDKMDQLFRQGDSPATGAPMYYSWNGVSPSGDTQVDLYPVPDGLYEVEFQCIVPQTKLTSNDDVILIPSEPVVEGTLAYAIAERGEDGGTLTSLQMQLYKNVLSDLIAIEANHFGDELTWLPS
jgi:hypothetical protein